GGIHDDAGHGSQDELTRHLPEVRPHLPEKGQHSTVGHGTAWYRRRISPTAPVASSRSIARSTASVSATSSRRVAAPNGTSRLGSARGMTTSLGLSCDIHVAMGNGRRPAGASPISTPRKTFSWRL